MAQQKGKKPTLFCDIERAEPGIARATAFFFLWKLHGSVRFFGDLAKKWLILQG